MGLLITIVALCVVLCPVAYWSYGWAGLGAVASAGSVCAFTGMAAFSISRRCHDGDRLLSGILGAMGVRMGIPLAICLILAVRGNAHSLSGFVYFLLIFYLATLAVETWCSLPVPTRDRPTTVRD